MAPFWFRALLFPEQNHSSSPMWNRKSTRVPIFEEPQLSPSQMWSRPANLAPIFEEPLESPSPMWDREASSAPVCPCCTTPQATVVEQVSPRPSTSSIGPPPPVPQRSLKSAPSFLSLRLKKSFRQLRRRPSNQSL